MDFAKKIFCGNILKIGVTCTGIDLSKILGGQTKILGEKVIKSDKCIGISQLLGEHVPGLPPKVYAYGYL